MDKNKISILLVEDEVITAMSEKMELEKYGYSVDYVTTGEKAVSTVIEEDFPIDLILMDIDLGPGIDGTQAAEQILGHKDIPVVFLSSHTEPEVVEKTERITSYGYVVKNSGIVVLDASIKIALKLFNAKTLKEQAEATLRESEEKYRAISEDMPVMICRYLPDYTISYVNKAYCTYFNRSAGELVGTSFLSLIPESDHEAVRSTIEALNIDSPTIIHEHQAINADQLLCWQRWTNRALFDKQGNITDYQSIGEDITERKRADEKLNKLSEAIELSMDGIAILDENEKYVYVNDAHARIYGYDSHEELLGKSWEVLYDEEELERFKNEIMPQFKYEGMWKGEAVGKNKVGAIFPQEVSLTTLEGGGMICVVRDTTERKQAEEINRKLSQRIDSVK